MQPPRNALHTGVHDEFPESVAADGSCRPRRLTKCMIPAHAANVFWRNIPTAQFVKLR